MSQLHKQLSALAEDARPLIVDLDQVSFTDATGLEVLAGAARRASAPACCRSTSRAPAR